MEDHVLRQRITAELRRLWQEAKNWESQEFSGEPLVVLLRKKYEARATATRLEEQAGKVGRGLQFRLTWKVESLDYFVDLLVSIQSEGDAHFFPYGGVRVLTGNAKVPTEGDIFWGEFKDESVVNMPLISFCRRQLERACRHKNENKIFRYKQRS